MKTKLFLILAVAAIIGYTFGTGATSVVESGTQSKIEMLNKI